MIATIHQPQYLPWLGYFDKAARADIFILLDDVQFKKNDWQNRNKIRTSQGWQWLTVPVIHDFGQTIMEVKINNQTDWRKAHFQAINLNYRKAPYFDQYIDFFRSVYEREWEYLVDLNIFLIEKFIEFLGIKTRIVRSSKYHLEEKSTQRLIRLCNLVNVDTYIAGAGGSAYANFGEFEESRIHVIVQEYQHPVYPQLWQNSEKGFMSHLAAIDLLFNCGDRSLPVL
ncbi:MAG: WbqC family protein, partial [Candidatus Omnitrophica bacterium]|nr:WbqC family protein [Candidatus Omnitrophota bacterium]